jgi:hypothetical protein
MASRLRADRHRSALQEFLDTGYVTARDDISISDLETWFSNHPDQVLAWAMFSVDQRCTPTLVLATTRFPGDPWKVISVNPEGEIVEVREFVEGAQACAVFVKGYVEMLVDIASAS